MLCRSAFAPSNCCGKKKVKAYKSKVKNVLFWSNIGLDYSSAVDLIFTLFNDLSTGQMMTVNNVVQLHHRSKQIK